MSGALIIAIFVAVLIVAARLWLRPERPPPIPSDDHAEIAVSSRPAAERLLSVNSGRARERQPTTEENDKP